MNKKAFLFLVFFFILTFPASWAAKDISITPTPQNLVYKNCDVEIKKDWSIVVGKDDEEIFSVARYLVEELLNRFDLLMGIQRGPSAQMEKRIVLKLLDEQLKELGEQGYVLEVFEDYILITANKPAGIFYGIQTLLQLTKTQLGKIIVSAVNIIDFPKTKFRGVHINAASLENLKREIDTMSELKMNVAIIENWAFFNLDKDDNKEKLVDVFDYAREHFIEPIPHLNSFSYAGPALSKDPYAAEGIWVKDEHFKFVNGEAVAIKPTEHTLVNVIRCEDSNIIVTSLDKTKTYKVDVDYKIIEGDISYPFSLNNRPTKITRINSGNIRDGDEVLVSYDYVERKTAPWATWTAPYCPSSERTYKIMFNALEDVITALNPKYISIGHDEILGLNRDSRCKKRNLTNAEILANEINRLNDFVKSLNSDIRLMMWDDMVTPWHNGGNENLQVQFGGIPGKTSYAIDLIPNDMIMMVWWYDSNDRLNKMKNSPNFFESKGFDYLVAGYKDKKNIKDWSDLIKNKERCLGIITTTWDGWEKNIKGIRYTAEIGWH